MEPINKYWNRDTNFYYQKNGIRRSMCAMCPHKSDVKNRLFNDEDEDFIAYGHSHRCHAEGDKEIACRGVCEKAKLLGKTLMNECDINANY